MADSRRAVGSIPAHSTSTSGDSRLAKEWQHHQYQITTAASVPVTRGRVIRRCTITNFDAGGVHAGQ